MSAYTPTVWVNNTAPALSAANLDKLTNELESQAAAKGVPHTLPDWTDNAAPALTDAAPLNEMERVLLAVADVLSLPYTRTTWENGWTPARNAARFNRMEQQAALNRNAIDTQPTGLTKPFGYKNYGGVWPPSHLTDYKLTLGVPGTPPSAYTGKRLRYVSSLSCSATLGDTYGVSYQEAHANGWILTDAAGELTNVSHSTNYLGDAGLTAYRARWCQNVESHLAVNGNMEGMFVDDTQAHIAFMAGGRIPTKYPTDQSWYDAMVGFCAYVYAYFNQRGKYVLWNARNWKAGDGNSDNPALRTTWFWTDLGPHSDGLMYETWIAHPAFSSVNRMRTVSSNFWNEARALHPLCQSLGVDFVPLDEPVSPDTALEKRYGRATWLLDWNGTSGAHVWDSGSNADPWTALDSTILALGAPTAAATKSGDVWTRQFQNGTVTINPVAGTASIV